MRGVVDVRAAAIPQPRNQAALLDDADQAAERIVRVGRPVVTNVLPMNGGSDVEQQTIADRRRPGDGPGAQSGELPVLFRLGRDARLGELPRPCLVLVVDVDLVPGRYLPRDTGVHGVVRQRSVGLRAQIGVVGPRIGVAGVEIVPETGDVAPVGLPARAREEPQLVLHQRSADRDIVVVQILEMVGRLEPQVLEVCREVAVLEAGVRRGAEKRSLEGVAALARNEVEDHPAGNRLGRARRVVDGDFLAAADVRNEVRRLSRTRHVANRQAVHHLPLVGRATVVDRHAAQRERALAADVLRAARHAGDEHRQVGLSAPDRDRVDDVLAHDALLHRALDVDDRGLPGHRDRFAQQAHLELGVDGGRERARELNPFALEGREPGQRKRHRVGAGPEVDDAILARPVGDHGADFFDQRRTRCLDGHTGQQGTGRILDGAGDRSLGEHQAGEEQYARNDEHAGPGRPTHTALLC